MSGVDEGTTATRPPERKLVVAALCTDRQGRVLLTRRLPGQPMGGLWELPGGKVELGEPPAAALAREVQEELDCPCRVGAIYDIVHHNYARFELVMVVYRVTLLREPVAREVAEIAWVPPSRLTAYEGLPADVELVAEIARRGPVDPLPPRVTFEQLTRDRTTGCLNAHAWHQRLVEEVDRATRYGRPLSLILIDVDELEALNDRHGRGVGDQILAQLVGLMAQSARAIDHVGRVAGGFALLLPETTAGAALGISERLRADIAARRLSARGPVEGVGHDVQCTVSCGVAALRPGRTGQLAGLIDRADAALWRAKLAGRNRTIVDTIDDPAASREA
jgi:mutator protein MutT